jgi:hypothetical protein
MPLKKIYISELKIDHISRERICICKVSTTCTCYLLFQYSLKLNYQPFAQNKEAEANGCSTFKYCMTETLSGEEC